jgi:hypothetical protein
LLINLPQKPIEELKLSCPKCNSTKNIICLAGGIVLTQTQQIPLYCLACRENFLAIKKEGLETNSEYLSFEVIAPDQKLLNHNLSNCGSRSLKKFVYKRKK